MASRVKNNFDGSFDVFAGDYDEVRPGYPKDFYQDIFKICKLGRASRVIEVGVGSGIGTVELAKSGCALVGLEPAVGLAAIAEKKTKSCPSVEIVKTTFEDYQPSEKFDCLIVLTAFHWIRDEVKYTKSADLLSRDGRLVVGWNSFLQSVSEVTRKINSLYWEMLSDIYPEQDEAVNAGVFTKLKKREREFFENDLFEVEFFRRYLTIFNYDKKTYPALLRTFPKITRLEKPRREKFLEKVGETIEKHGTIAVPVLTTLLIAGKKETLREKISRA